MSDPIDGLFPKDIFCSHQPAMQWGGKDLSYKDLISSISTCADHLHALGIQRGDRIGILSSNSPEVVIALFAIWHLGAVACLLNTRNPDRVIKDQASSIGCRVILTDGRIWESGRIQAIPLCQCATPSRFTQGKELNFSLTREATIIFTSGSSARPKAVCHTLSNHYFNAKGANAHISVVPGDQWLLSLPMYHVGGLGIIFRSLMSGAMVVLPDPDVSLRDALLNHRITHISLVATQLKRFLRDPECVTQLKKMKAVLVGGGAIAPGLIDDALTAGVPLYVTYGLTEMASQVATSGCLTRENLLEGARVLEHRHLRISDAGEIGVKGETLFKGYVQDSGYFCPVDADGFFATGDLGRFTDQGGLVVTGRKDYMFISGGENIQPEEIEKILCGMEKVQDAVVVAVADDEFGFRPAAFLKSESDLNTENIRRFLRGHLAGYKIPVKFYRWPETEALGQCFKADRERFRCLAESAGGELI